MVSINRIIRKSAAGLAVCLLTISTSLSDDIDVYVSPPASASPGDTFVVFTLDVRPNVMASTVCTGDAEAACQALFSDPLVNMEFDGNISFFELLIAALKKVLRGQGRDNIQVALMIPHADTVRGQRTCVGYQSGSVSESKRCSNGAYVLSAFRSTGDQAQLDMFFEKLEAVPLKDGGNWGHPYQLKEVFFEMYRYLTAGRVYNGHNGWEDFGTDETYNINEDPDTVSVHPDHSGPIAELTWDPDAQQDIGTEKFYKNALDTANHCSSVFSVNLTDGTASNDSDADGDIQADAPLGLGLTLDGSNFRSRIQVLEYLANTDLDDSLVGSQHVTSYFVAKPSGGSGKVGGRSNDWAQAGGTGSAVIATENADELVDLFSDLFNEILGVSTTFVAASVPANVFNRAETLNEVFLAIFEPDEAEQPYWVGNVKKLTTTTIEETVDCVDENANGVFDDGECTTEERRILVDVLEAGKDDPTAAVNPLDGRIRSGALTYWTQTGTDNEYLPPPTTSDEEELATGEDLEFEEGTDGRKVDRGGAGQVKPGYLGDTNSPGVTNPAGNTVMAGPRKLFTEPLAAGDLLELNAVSLTNTTANALLNDTNLYPGTSQTYGEFLYETVMSDCVDCTYDPSDETARRRVSNLIRYARGLNPVLGEDGQGLDTPLSETLGKRAWWQADPLHSRPLALNYGARTDEFTQERPDIRILVAGNDGLVQMIRDGRVDDGSENGSEDGVEAWAFLPREFVALQKRLWEGTQGAYFPGQPVPAGDPPRDPLHPYAMDGGPTALVIDNNLDGTIDTSANDRVLAYVGQRRGGKRYYALDLSDPDNPEYLWSIGKSDADGEFAELGQSWSLLRAGVMPVLEGSEEFNRPVLIFTGGYNGDDGGDGDGDMGKDRRLNPGADGLYGTADDEIAVGTNDTEGNALFIVNALTGDLIWKAVGPDSTADGTTTQVFQHNELVDSVASTPTVVDSDGNGHIDRVYFPDTGGNVWRMDAGVSDRDQWTVTKLFAGGRHVQNDTAGDRRFFNAPDIVFASDDSGDFDAVILASGDRAHPLGTEVDNWIYMIKDRATTSGNPSDTTLTHDDLADLSNNCLQSDPTDFSDCVDAETTDDNEIVLPKLGNGWKVRLEQCEAGGSGEDCGEKSLASPLTIEGTIFLTSYLPVLDSVDGATDAPATCGPKEGSGLFYALDLQTAGGVLDFDPENNAGGVETPDRFDRLKSRGIPPEPVAISPQEVLRPDLQIQKTEGRRSSRTFWYERRFN